MSERREHGQGTVSFLKDRNKWWARGPRGLDGNRPSLGTFDTEEEANHRLKLASAGSSLLAKGGTLTFASYGETALDQREANKHRSIKMDRSRFKWHLKNSLLGPMDLTKITSDEILELAKQLKQKDRCVGGKVVTDPRHKKKISKATLSACMVLTSAIFEASCADKLRSNNPCAGVKYKKLKGPREEKNPELDEDFTEVNYLPLASQLAIYNCKAIPEHARVLIAFCIGTGMRQGEVWNLELRDLHVTGDAPYVYVRYGSPGLTPKNGNTRKVPLFGVGLEAAKRQLELLPEYLAGRVPGKSKPYENECGLVFPTLRGLRRRPGAPSKTYRDKRKKCVKRYMLPVWLRAAGIARSFRWHDLRHTCASSLVMGTWGRRWTLKEIAEHLGHSSTAVTERYAHLGNEALTEAAKEAHAAFAGYGIRAAKKSEKAA